MGDWVPRLVRKLDKYGRDEGGGRLDHEIREDLLLSHRRNVGKVDGEGGLRGCCHFRSDTVLFASYIGTQKAHIVCVLASGVVLVLEGKWPYCAVMEMKFGAKPRSRRGNLFSIGSATEDGVYVLISLGSSALDVMEMNLGTKSWHMLAIEDSTLVEISPLCQGIATGQERWFGLVVAATEEKLYLYDHRGLQGVRAEVGVGAVAWTNNCIFTLSKLTGEIVKWTVVPTKQGKHRKLILQEIPGSRLSLSQRIECDHVSLCTIGDSVFGSAVYNNSRCSIYASESHSTFSIHFDAKNLRTVSLGVKRDPFLLFALVNDACIFVLEKHAKFPCRRFISEMPAIPTAFLCAIREQNACTFYGTKLDALGETGLVYDRRTFSVRLLLDDQTTNLNHPHTNALLDFLPRGIQDAILVGYEDPEIAVLCENCRRIECYSIASKALLQTYSLERKARFIFRSKDGEVVFEDAYNHQFYYARDETEPYFGTYFELEASHLYKVETKQHCRRSHRELMCSLLISQSYSEFSIVGMFREFLLYAGHEQESVTVRPLADFSVKTMTTTSISKPEQKEVLLEEPQRNIVLFQVPAISVTKRNDTHHQQKEEKVLQHRILENIQSVEDWLAWDLKSDAHDGDGGDLTKKRNKVSLREMNAENEDELHVVGYWRFSEDCEENGMVDLSQSQPPSIAGKPNGTRGQERIVDTVIDTCTVLDPGEEDFVDMPRAFCGPLYLQIPLLSDSHWTVEFWFRLHRIRQTELVDGISCPSLSLEMERWYHIAFVFYDEPREVQIYVNGGTQSLVTNEIDMTKCNSSFLLMPQATEEETEITECRVWNMSRSRSEILKCWNTNLELAERRKNKFIVRINE